MKSVSKNLFWLFVFLFLLGLFPAATSVRPRIDEDTWWHLRVGQWIDQQQQLPWHDPFSQVGIKENRPWLAYSWLYELGLFYFWKWWDLSGILYFRTLLSFSVYAYWTLFILSRSASSRKGLIILSAMTVSVLPLLAERPWHFSILFTTLTLDILLRIREGKPIQRCWWLPLVYVIWANTHIQFVIGLGLLGLALVIAWMEQQRWQPYAFLGISCFVATLVTPYHLHLYGVIWEYATQTTPMRIVQELLPPDWSHWMNWPFLFLILWAGIELFRSRFSLWNISLFAAGLLLTLRIQRDLWFGVLAVGTVLVQVKSTEKSLLAKRHLFLVVLASYIFLRIIWNVSPASRESIADAQKISYPVDAIAFVKQHQPVGPLFNDFNWGGYLIWHLPEYPVVLDGRTNLHGEARLARLLNTWNAGANWQEDPDLQRANLIIAPCTLALTNRLLEDVNWQVVYQDHMAIVFVRRTVN